MPDFKKNSKFGGGGRSGGFARPSFGGARRGGRDFGRPQGELFTATCNNCNATCEVPFRPNGTKPVYCKNCFVRNDEPRAEGRSYEKHPFSEQRPAPMRAPSATSASDPRIGAMQNELKEVHAKLDMLIERIGGVAYASILAASTEREEAAPKKAVQKPAAKKVAKKVTKKKA